MTENGSLRFVVGLNALASGYDTGDCKERNRFGNMTLRLKDGARCFLAYDAENRLKTVSGTVSASFVYNGDGQRVASTISTTTTAYIGGYFEWQAGSGTCYYFAGAQRVAMCTSAGVKFLLGDHLGSTAVTAYANGAFDTETRYYPWGGVRWSYGAPPTDYQFTGQQNVASIGLYFFNARWYDSALGRFVQADTIIPNPRHPLSFDRFAYVQNNPIKYTDPTGHWSCGDQYDPACAETTEEKFQYYLLTNPLPPGMELPPELPTVVDDDMQLLLAFVYLWNTPTGRVFAQLILDENVILSWALEGELSTTEKTGKGTLSGELVPTIQVSISVDDYWNPAAAAVALAHEAVHVLMHDHPNSQWEEYTAYRIESEVASELNGHGWASLNIRYQFSSDPRPSPGYLEEWAKLYRLYGIQFQSLPPYPNALDYLSP